MATTTPPNPLLRWLLVRIVTTIVYAIVGTVASTVAARAALRAPPSGGDEHARSVRALVARPCTLRLDDVGGLFDAKRELRRTIVRSFAHPGVFFGPVRELRAPVRVLLHGAPGTGKTMLARAVASESGVALLSLHAAALESKWYGDSAKLLHAAFAVAAEVAPCIVFFDEIDGFGRARSEMDQSCVYSFKCELLRHLDAVAEREEPVVVLACTNHVGSLDAALRRRFSKIVSIDLPDEKERYDILRRIHPGGARRHAAKIARATPGWTGANLATLVSDASLERLDDVSDAALASGDASSIAASIPPITWAQWTRAAARSGLAL